MNKETKVELLTGKKMPVMGLGTWQLTPDTAAKVAAAIEMGYRMIDTSSDYGTQPGIGEGIKDSGIKRSDLYICTKVEEDDDAYQRTLSNLDELQTDYADMMLIHRPPPEGPGHDLWEGLVRAKEEGLVKDIGVSNYSIELIDELISAGRETPAVNQIEWSPYGFSREMFDYCRKKGIVIQAYSPLTRGERLDEKKVEKIAENYGKTPAQIIVRWNLQKSVVPIPKAEDKEHMRENIEVFDFELKKEDVDILDGLNENYSSLGTTLEYL